MRTAACLAQWAIMLCPYVAGAQSLDSSLRTLAGELARAMDQACLKCVGVPELANVSGTLGGDTGASGQCIAERVEEHLVNAPGHRYTVVERRRLNTVLQEVKVQCSGLTDARSTHEVLGKIKGLDALVVGSLTRLGRTLQVSAKVVRLPEAAVVAMKPAEARLDADLLTLFGDSVLVPAAPGEEVRTGLGTGTGKRIDVGVTEVAFRAAASPAAILSLHYDAAEVVEQCERVR